MEYRVDAPEWETGKVTVRIAGPFSGPTLWQGDKPVPRDAEGVYTIPESGEPPARVRLRSNGLDIVPVAEVNGRDVRLAPPLAWYGYLWAGLPLLLVLLGGVLGGLLGATAAYLNLYLIRSRKASIGYGLSAVVTLGVFVLYLLTNALLLTGKR